MKYIFQQGQKYISKSRFAQREGMVPSPQIIIMGNIQNAIRNGDIEAVKAILQNDPSSASRPGERGFPPIIFAAYSEDQAICELLIEAGANVNAQDMAGNTALMGVCFKGFNDIAQFLIDKGADVNLKNKTGGTALSFAATFNQNTIAKLLLANGAEVNIKDQNGQTPLELAQKQDNKELVALLQAH